MNIGEVLSEAYSILKGENIDTYIIDAQLLLQKVLQKDKVFIIINRDLELKESEKEQFFKLLEMRRNKMPVKYILGECEFMGMNFTIKEGVLIPRGDTEILVEKALEEIDKNKYKRVCDVCCGSGAIGISIGKLNENAQVLCLDISDTACQVTQENINKFNISNRVKVIKSDLLNEAIKNNLTFDIIVSNPPYIRENVIPSLMEDVKNYEPYIALSGGKDGLDFYRKITKQSLELLETGGMLAYEIGYDQREDVERILLENQFTNITCSKDLAGLDRVVIGTRC
ncbi:release factor glutamine methyltransferase [Clostridium homopropionicum DSM 5847]|uniref:Release factor glutamine methyltransferase n=1 Tax=Clostridium homopropionicum DSM 5847 TaxID=1121318 RepID=A0A0L6Z5X4_9CLOT|nr:peptide chain release factor N(5)-glutamine methyltransferase [Clostridium homopropionicum]KOA18372.1 release factor glutamine methyltransferase [Clostridium homopropionicum DSM 5847]SFF68243.1 release factor glutamine methyltransferase [Clostridium homopropionicum]